MKSKINATKALSGLVTGLLLFISMASQAHSALVLTAVGIPETGESTWTFSGSYVVTTGGTVNANTTSSTIGITNWAGVGDYFRSYPLPGSVPDGLHAFDPGGTVQLTGSLSGALSIDSVLLVHGGGNLDSWGFASNSSHTYQAGETLTFSGTAVLPVDILALGGDYHFLPLSFSKTLSGATVNFTAQAVPEPSRSLLLLGGLLGMVIRRRRSRCITA